MTKRVFAASHERGVQLTASGCPIAYPDDLPGHPDARREQFHAEQLDGEAESCAYALGPLQTGYVIGVRLWTDCPSGTVITNWNFTPPWDDHKICWDYEPLEIIPARDIDAYTSLLNPRLEGVLDEHHLLSRGFPVAGLLCGLSDQPIPECVEGYVTGTFTMVDDKGSVVPLRIALGVVHTAASRLHRSRTDAGRHLERMRKRVPIFVE